MDAKAAKDCSRGDSRGRNEPEETLGTTLGDACLVPPTRREVVDKNPAACETMLTEGVLRALRVHGVHAVCSWKARAR